MTAATALPRTTFATDLTELCLTLTARRQARTDQIEALLCLTREPRLDVDREKELALARAELARLDAALAWLASAGDARDDS